MKNIFFISLIFLPSLSQAAFTVQGTITIGGVSYTWPTTQAVDGQCLITDGNNPPTLRWGFCSGITCKLLLEDSSFVFLEDGTNILMEVCGTAPAASSANSVLFENSDTLIMEDGTEGFLE